MAVFERGEQGADAQHGHVAYVTSVLGSRFWVSEMSAGGNFGRCGVRTDGSYHTSSRVHFIYAAPTLFEDINFRGDWRHFESSYPDFVGSWSNPHRYQYSEDNIYGILNDSASSLWVPYSYGIGLHKDTYATCPANRDVVDGSSDALWLDTRFADFRSLRFSDGAMLNDSVSGITVLKEACYISPCGGAVGVETQGGSLWVSGGVCSPQPTPCGDCPPALTPTPLPPAVPTITPVSQPTGTPFPPPPPPLS